MFGKDKDPTKDWPEPGQAPALDLERKAIGPLRLGDSFDGAKSLGRPKRLHGSASVNVGDFRLSPATKPLDAKVWFGDASSDSTGGGGLRWLDFVRDGATLALEFDAKGLICVQLYAEGYA